MRFVIGLIVVELLKVHALKLTKLQQSHGVRGNEYYKQPMKNIEDVSYVATMGIGNQQLDAVLDTGSFDVEVFSTRCGSSCKGAGSSFYYDRSGSNTYKEGDLIQLTSYESGDVLAQSGTEKISFGSLEIDSLQFWEVVYAKLDILVYGDFQAIVGVGPPGADAKEVESEAEAAEYMKSQFQKLGFEVPQGFSKEKYESEVPKMKSVLEMLGTRIFSVCLGRRSGSQGYFVWNDYNAANNPAFREVDVAGKLTWGVQLTDTIMKDPGVGKDYEVSCSNGSPCAAIVDSGTSLLMVPTKVYNTLFGYLKKLGASCDHMDQLPSIVFKLAGQEVALPPAMYMGLVSDSSLERHSDFFPFLGNQTMSLSQTRGGESCELLIGKIDVDTQMGPMWILGMPFFRQYYTTFELGADLRNKGDRRLYLAKADSDCEPQSSTELVYEENSNTPMSLKSAKLQIPKWAVHAHRKGRIEL